MLGQMVKLYFGAKTNSLICYDEKLTDESRHEYLDFLRSLNNAIVINCAADINNDSSERKNVYVANVLLPLTLRESLPKDVVLVQPSTDGVFRGNKGEPYGISDIADAEDDYGWSKRLCEAGLKNRTNTLVPRVSIIGPNQIHPTKGLFAWALSNSPGTTIQGYTNHLWNGITTLEWCRRIEDFLINESNFEFTLLQLGTNEHYSKYEVLRLINETFKLKLNIEPSLGPSAVDRRLIPDLVSEKLEVQLMDLYLCIRNKTFNG